VLAVLLHYGDCPVLDHGDACAVSRLVKSLWHTPLAQNLDSTKTVLYCTVLYCTVLWLIMCVPATHFSAALDAGTSGSRNISPSGPTTL